MTREAEKGACVGQRMLLESRRSVRVDAKKENLRKKLRKIDKQKATGLARGGGG